VTGGLAYGKVDLEGTSTVSGTTLPFSITHAIGHSHVNAGWTLGYGTEGVIAFWGARKWTWRVETLYMDLGHLNDTDAAVVPCIEGPCTAHVTGGGQTTTNTHFTDWILRGGLSYQFH
jgi:opacity protein-like surface antigen